MTHYAYSYSDRTIAGPDAVWDYVGSTPKGQPPRSRPPDRLRPATHLRDVKTTQSSLVGLGASENKSTGFRPT